MSKMKKLFIISDLHLGGKSDQRDSHGNLTEFGSQICHSYDQLKEFLNWVCNEAINFDGDVEIIINGDIVDFLAEDEYNHDNLNTEIWTHDENHAIKKLEQIINRTKGKDGISIFDVLKKFTQNGNHLTLILGNHDVELSLPNVRRYLEEILTPNGSLKFIFDGEAYTCGDVLIEHGNRYDSWNMINHSRLRQERSILSRGLIVDEKERNKKYFLPPAGTLLVIYVINKLKKRFRFVDLLKPETGAVIPILLTINEKTYQIINDILRISPALTKQKISSKIDNKYQPKKAGYLSATRKNKHLLISTSDILNEEIGKNAKLFELEQENNNGNLMFDKEKTLNIDILKEKSEGLLNLTSMAMDNFSGGKNIEKLKIALRKIQNDISFNISKEDLVYLKAAEKIINTGKYSCVVFGHTHLPKKIHIQTSNEKSGIYFNTGTWTNIIKLPEDLFLPAEKDIDEKFNDFIFALETNQYSSYQKQYLSFVEVTMIDNKMITADLHSYCGKGRERESPLTEFPV